MPPAITQEEQGTSQRPSRRRQLRESRQTPTQPRQTTRVEPSITADKLVNPPAPIQLPQPVQSPIPARTGQIVSNITRDLNGFISAQTDEARRLKEMQATYGALGDQGSLSDLFTQTQADYGVTPDTFKELKDIQLQLSDRQTASEMTKTKIAGAAGQTLDQAQREITQEDREAAVRDAGLAARAAVLQGNIETATAVARDAVDIAFKDRQDKANNLLNQITMLQGQVDDQTAQLLEQDKRDYEAELSRIEELKTNIASAMVNGATQSEISQLNDPKLDDAAKLALAQSITARGATEMRNLEMEQKRASAAASWNSARKTQMEIDAINSTATGQSNMAVQALDSFSGALDENKREQFTRAVTAGVQRGNPEQVTLALKNAAQVAGGAALRDEVIKRDQAINALKSIKTALSEYEAAGGNTNILVGGYEDLQNKLGQTADPTLNSIETRIGLALNSYTNAVSGASFTPQESARYESLFPSTSNTPVLNKAKLETLVDTFEANNQSYYSNFFGGYTPSQIAEQAVYQELIANATPEQLKEAGISQ